MMVQDPTNKEATNKLIQIANETCQRLSFLFNIQAVEGFL